MAVVVAAQFFFAAALFFFAAGGGDAAFVEHTFVVSKIRLKQLGEDKLVTVVNGQLPGPTLEVKEGDSLAVHLVNKSPYGITIHWHGVKQRLNCWADGVGMITQCPIQPNSSFTYRFNVVGQEGTLWWHAHVPCLRATIHGVLLIRPRSGAGSYPFPRPHMEIPIVIGEWWNNVDLVSIPKDKTSEAPCVLANPTASTINGKAGDLHKRAGIAGENFVLDVERRKTYLLRIVNAALQSEYYFKIAGHKFTVVAADANYVKPYTTDIIAIAPGETVDALLVADAPPNSKYYMVGLATQRPKPDTQVPMSFSSGVVQYKPSKGNSLSSNPMMPKMPDQHDYMPSFYFHGNLTSMSQTRLAQLSVDTDERLFITLATGITCKDQRSSCNFSIGSTESFPVATMNSVSFQFPTTTPLLEAHYYNNMSSVDTIQEMPDKPPKMFNFTNTALITAHSMEAFQLASSSRATMMRRFRYNTSVEIVFQGTTLWQSESNPMHLHGHDFFVLAQGLGRYDAEKDVKNYNLIDPAIKNTVLVPAIGWAVIRFVTDNPGMWYMHCHFEFHATSGMAVAFQVDNGPTVDTTLLPPPSDFPRCQKDSTSRVASE